MFDVRCWMFKLRSHPSSLALLPSLLDLPPPRRHRQRQDGGLSAGHRPRAGAGQRRDCLVPEISLTPQTVERFKARFSPARCKRWWPCCTAILSAGERHDEWHKIRQGRARIVIGARSAIFAPVEPLGLIVVDEEHEHSYKQEEAPRYHARDVAIVRGQMEGAVVLLGSATPSLESYYNCARANTHCSACPSGRTTRRCPSCASSICARPCERAKAGPIFSAAQGGDQRGGWSEGAGHSLPEPARLFHLAAMPRCGYVAECPNCSVSLTYHRHENKLCCHICGHIAAAPGLPERVPQPGDPLLRRGHAEGRGTPCQALPARAVTVRMDADVMKRKDDYRRILGDFRTGKIDILVGTQMIAKGLHFPNVTLVGIINADLALHQPDFRAGERTFQLTHPGRRARGPRRHRGRGLRPGLHAVSARRFSSRGITTSRAFTSRRSSSARGSLGVA
jgi:primosomal protein N' (replication factor Y)